MQEILLYRIPSLQNYLLYFVQGKISLEDCLKYCSKRLEEEIINLAFEEISLKKKIEENN